MTVGAAAHGVVLEGTGGIWRVRIVGGDTVDVSLRGRLKKADVGRRADGSIRRDTLASSAETLKLAVGDDVLLERDARDEVWVIDQILPRRSRLARRAPGGGFGERIVAANVDQVVVVFAAAKPEPHPRMLDRFLVIAEANALSTRVIINKVDLVVESEIRAKFVDYERAGYPVHYTSTKANVGLRDMRTMLGGKISVLTGPSGVGKSSLLNALFPGLHLRVGEISESVNKGRHTTVGARMIPLPAAEGGYVVDTPGLREVGMWALQPAHLDACFPEFRSLLDQCRFSDCTHTVEPGCAVRGARDRGEASRARYDSYLKLRDELLGVAPKG